MLKTLRMWFTYGGLLVAFLGTLFVVAYLQEFAGDDIPEIAREAGVSLPLKDPRLEVILQNMTLALYEGDVLLKRYSVGYGHKMPGRANDREGSTPLGEYMIVDKQERKDLLSRGTRFLRFDFPGLEDADKALDAGEITREDYEAINVAHRLDEFPPSDTALLGPLGIQGNYFFFQDRRFTDGSLALSNGDINELYEYVPIGTPVVIKMH